MSGDMCVTSVLVYFFLRDTDVFVTLLFCCVCHTFQLWR